MHIDFRLQVFKTVAERLNFTKAAEELYITQPAITKHIKELETQLSVALFLRQGNKIELTSKGKILLRHANSILNLYKQLNDEFSDDNTVEKGIINIGASTTISQYVLPSILAKFKQQYNEVKVILFNGNSEQIEKLTTNGKLDVGLIEGNITMPTLHYESFKQDEIVLIASNNRKAFKVDEIDISQLKKLPLVLRENGSGTLDVIDTTFAKYGINKNDLNIEMRLGSTEGIKRYLLNSNTFALLSIAAISDEVTAKKLQVINITDIKIVRTFRFVSVHGQHSRLVDIFKNFCLTHQ